MPLVISRGIQCSLLDESSVGLSEWSYDYPDLPVKRHFGRRIRRLFDHRASCAVSGPPGLSNGVIGSEEMERYVTQHRCKLVQISDVTTLIRVVSLFAVTRVGDEGLNDGKGHCTTEGVHFLELGCQ